MSLTPEQITSLLDALDELAPSASKLRRELESASTATIETLKNSSELAAVAEQVAEALDRELRKREEILNNLQEENKQAERRFRAENDILKQYELAKEVNETRIEQLKKQLEYTEAGTAESEELLKAIAKIKDAQKDLNDASAEYSKELDKAKQTVDDIQDGLVSIAKGDFIGGFKKIGQTLAKSIKPIGGKMFTKLKDKFVANLAQMGQKLPEVTAALGPGAGGAGGAMTGFAGSVGAAGAALGPLAAALFVVLPLLIALATALGVTVKIFQFALELENSARQLTKVTGLSKDFSHAMHENADSLKEFGATAEDINAAVTALNATFTDFSLISTVSAQKVKDTTVVLSKLGMSADDAAKGFQTLTKGLAQTPEQAAATMLELDAIARDLDVSTAKMGADFAGASVHLQKLSGPEAIQAFKQLAVVSKATGIEVSRLLAITEKFDTFEGAATQAGKLNAALGGNFVNAMELLTATNPVERFEMIRDSILDAGLSFDEMSYYQKKFFADAAGMQDVGELALAMGGDFGAVGDEIGKTQADYENAAARAREFQSVQEQLKNTFASLIPVVKPLVKEIGEFATAFSEFVLDYKDEIQAVFKGLIFIAMGLGAAMLFALAPIILVTTAIGAITGVIVYALGKFGLFIASVTGLRKAISVDHSSPTLLGGLKEMIDGLGMVETFSNLAGGSVDKLKSSMGDLRGEMFSGDKNLVAGVQMTAEGVEGIGDASAKTASTMRATAPTVANNTAIQKAVTNTTVNNNGGGESTGINIKFDNKKMSELFDIQVEKSMGKAARKAAIGGR